MGVWASSSGWAGTEVAAAWAAWGGGTGEEQEEEVFAWAWSPMRLETEGSGEVVVSCMLCARLLESGHLCGEEEDEGCRVMRRYGGM